MGPARKVGKRRLVRRHHAGLGAPLDRHVAHGHPALHRQRADGGAAVLDQVALTRRGPGAADEPEDDVLRGDADRQLAFHVYGQVALSLLRQALRGQHELDLRGPDPEGKRPERAVRRGVRVAADDQHPGLGQAELGPDHVHDPLAPAADLVQRDPLAPAVLGQHLHLLARQLVSRADTAAGGHVVVHGRHAQVRAPDLAPRQPQPLEGLG